MLVHIIRPVLLAAVGGVLGQGATNAMADTALAKSTEKPGLEQRLSDNGSAGRFYLAQGAPSWGGASKSLSADGL